MDGVKSIICDYCGKACGREFAGKLLRVDCDCTKKATRPDACSQLPACVLCGRTEYPVEYGPRHNKLPAGSLVGFDNGDQVWICRRCSRDPAAIERLENDPALLCENRGADR